MDQDIEYGTYVLVKREGDDNDDDEEGREERWEEKPAPKDGASYDMNMRAEERSWALGRQRILRRELRADTKPGSRLCSDTLAGYRDKFLKRKNTITTPSQNSVQEFSTSGADSRPCADYQLQGWDYFTWNSGLSPSMRHGVRAQAPWSDVLEVKRSKNIVRGAWYSVPEVLARGISQMCL